MSVGQSHWDYFCTIIQLHLYLHLCRFCGRWCSIYSWILLILFYQINKHYPHCTLCTRHASPSPVAKNRRPMGVERVVGGSLLLVPCQSIPRSSSAPDVHSKFMAPAMGGTRWVGAGLMRSRDVVTWYLAVVSAVLVPAESWLNYCSYL